MPKCARNFFNEHRTSIKKVYVPEVCKGFREHSHTESQSNLFAIAEKFIEP